MIEMLLILAGAAACLYIAIIYYSSALMGLAFALLLILAQAVIYLPICMTRLKVHIDIPLVMVEAGETAGVLLTIENRAGHNIARASVCMKWYSPITHRYSLRVEQLQNLAPGVNRIRFDVRLLEAGNYEVSLQRFWIHDLTGFIPMGKKIAGQAHALVFPKLAEVPVMISGPVRDFMGEAEIYDEIHAGDDPSETFSYREFRDGDRLQQVHWKLSARADELMVREFSMPRSCPICLLLNGSLAGRELEKAAGLSFTLLDQKIPHLVSWIGRKTQDLETIRVDDEESFYQFMTIYLQETSLEQADSLRQRFQDKYPNLSLLYRVEFKEKEVWINEEKLTENLTENPVFVF